MHQPTKERTKYYVSQTADTDLRWSAYHSRNTRRLPQKRGIRVHFGIWRRTGDWRIQPQKAEPCYSWSHDAQKKRNGRLPRDSPEQQCSDYNADGEIRGDRPRARAWARCGRLHCKALQRAWSCCKSQGRSAQVFNAGNGTRKDSALRKPWNQYK